MVKIKTERLILVIISFMLIYNPPIGRIKSLLVLFAISMAYILFNYRYVFQQFQTIIKGYFIWVALFCYIMIVAVVNNNSPAYLQSFIYILASVIPTSIMIASITKKKDHGLDYFIDSILYAGFIQCLISIASFFSANIKNILLSLMIHGGVFQEDTYNAYMVNLRLFGFSTGLTYGMPVVQAFLAIVALYIAINKKRSIKYYIMIPLFAFSSIINARSSIVIMGIGFLALLVTFPKDDINRFLLRVLKILGLIILAIILINVGLNILKVSSPTTYIWVEEGIEQISMFFGGDTSSGYFSYVADESKWGLPSGINMLFGLGIRVLNPNNTNTQTDIGYINDLFFGGLVYCIIMYLLMFKYIYSLRKYKDNRYPGFNRFLCLFFFVSFFVLNYKGYIFDLNNFFVLFIMLAVFCAKHGDEQSVFRDGIISIKLPKI